MRRSAKGKRAEERNAAGNAASERPARAVRAVRRADNRLSQPPRPAGQRSRRGAKRDPAPRPDRDDRGFRALVEFSSDATVLLGPDGAILYAAPSSARVTGYAPAELAGKNAFDLVHRDDADAWGSFFGRLLTRPGERIEDCFRFYTRARGWTWIEGAGRNLLADPGVGAIVINYRNRGERRGEPSGRESERQFRLLFERIPQPMLIFDPQSARILVVNHAAADLYGYGRDEMRGLHLRQLAAEPAQWRDETPPPSRHEGFHRWADARHARRDGAPMEVEIRSCAYEYDGRPAHLAQITEVTERKKLEEKTRQALKMEAIGRLAGGVAHDFNNLLTIITGCGELVLSELAPELPARRRVEEMQKAATRATALTRQLLAFGRRQIMQPRPVNLNEVVQGMVTMIRRLIGEDVELQLNLAPQLDLVVADPGQIEQVLMNLAINARDAMPGGGRLSFATRRRDLDGDFVAAHPRAVSGPYVELTVSDTGAGMDAATQARIFEPFFSTKGEHGTGLGLATVYGIVQQSKGFIWVASERGRGTTFTLHLPVRPPEPAPGPKAGV